MYVSLFCVTLFDTVMYRFACHVLSCICFVVTLTVTDGKQEILSNGWFSGGREFFFQKQKQSITCTGAKA